MNKRIHKQSSKLKKFLNIKEFVQKTNYKEIVMYIFKIQSLRVKNIYENRVII